MQLLGCPLLARLSCKTAQQLPPISNVPQATSSPPLLTRREMQPTVLC